MPYTNNFVSKRVDKLNPELLLTANWSKPLLWLRVEKLMATKD